MPLSLLPSLLCVLLSCSVCQVSHFHPGANPIKLFLAVNKIRNKLECLSLASKPFQPSLMFLCNARNLSLSGAPERFFTWVGPGLSCKHYTKLERLASYKHSSLLRKFVNYAGEKFCRIGSWSNIFRQGRSLP
jgi:hypothetical protein